MNSSLISVVIPVYNVEKYLPRCLDSVLEQTYTNLEVILIDDASMDNSLRICQSYAKKDSRVSIVQHIKNLGLSEARNTGLINCSGDYITFVDSDDIIHPKLIEILYFVMKNYAVELACAGWQHCSDDETSISVDIELHELSVEICDNHKAMRKMLSPNIGIPVWGRLYVNYVLKDKFFIPGMAFEDILFTTDLMVQVKKVAFIDLPLYGYRQTANSITHTVGRHSIDHIFAQEMRMAIVEKSFPELLEICRINLLNACLDLQYKILFLSNLELRLSHQRMINKYWKKYQFSSYELIGKKFPLSRKIIYIFAKGSIRLAAVLKIILIKLNDWRIDIIKNLRS